MPKNTSLTTLVKTMVLLSMISLILAVIYIMRYDMPSKKGGESGESGDIEKKEKTLKKSKSHIYIPSIEEHHIQNPIKMGSIKAQKQNEVVNSNTFLNEFNKFLIKVLNSNVRIPGKRNHDDFTTGELIYRVKGLFGLKKKNSIVGIVDDDIQQIELISKILTDSNAVRNIIKNFVCKRSICIKDSTNWNKELREALKVYVALFGLSPSIQHKYLNTDADGYAQVISGIISEQQKNNEISVNAYMNNSNTTMNKREYFGRILNGYLMDAKKFNQEKSILDAGIFPSKTLQFPEKKMVKIYAAEDFVYFIKSMVENMIAELIKLKIKNFNNSKINIDKTGEIDLNKLISDLDNVNDAIININSTLDKLNKHKENKSIEDRNITPGIYILYSIFKMNEYEPLHNVSKDRLQILSMLNLKKSYFLKEYFVKKLNGKEGSDQFEEVDVYSYIFDILENHLSYYYYTKDSFTFYKF